MKKFLLTLMFFVPFFLFAAIGDNGISIAPDGTTLKWEEGAWDFFIMHKSLVTDVANKTGATASNPQADTCIDPNIGSTYKLEAKHIPPDANVDRAFLIWVAPVAPSDINGPTDNSVTLTFTHATDPEITLTKEVTASKQGYLNANQNVQGDFEYEALYFPARSSAIQKIEQTGIFTYRVEVSDFMKEIIAMGEAKGMNSGEALYGDYNVKGMECSDDQSYLETSGLMGGWFIPFVYTSSHISAKKIYFYHGFQAYHFEENTITVSGFELPDEAIIKLGLVVFEGDPGLASAIVNDSDSPIYMQSAPPEGLSISGQTDPNNYAPMFNNCNPQKTTPLLYTEMFNSISSIFSWENPDNYWCVGDPINPSSKENPIEYAIDADILTVDASKDGPFYGIFLKGDNTLNLKVGANQDQAITNMLIVSVDTKLPDFDIPDAREKNYCSCSTDADTVCGDRPFYYTIKVQNWGQNVARDVQLQDTLPAQVDYVAGSTEIATKFDASGNGTDWAPVPDINGKFPYETPQLVSSMLDHCSAQPCQENTTAWIRFVVKPKANLSKNEVIRNSAVIISEGGAKYYSNSNIPLRLTLSTKCPAITECELPPKTQCGGIKVEGNENYCAEDKDCKDGKKCVNNECVLDTAANLTNGAKVSFGIGDNDQNKGNKDTSAETIIPNPSNALVLGQFYLLDENGKKDQSYEFHIARLKFNKDSDVEAKNFKLYKDENGDGKVNEGDKEIASSDSLESSQYIKFAITDPANRLTPAGIKNHFVVTADVSSNSTGNQPGKFNMVIEGTESFEIKDSGNVELSGDKINFATFRFEPSQGFVFTKGTVTPSVPSFSKFNGEHEILQIRTKSIGVADKIKSIKIKPSGNSVKFNNGIKSISLYIDANGNGTVDPGETLIQKLSSFENDNMALFSNLDGVLQYGADEEKYLIVKVELKMSLNEKVKITVPESGVKTATNDPVGLPVTSIEFVYECDKSNPNSCNSGDDEEGGCAISAISESDSNPLYVAAMLLAALFGLLVFRFSRDGMKNR